ncbi:MAG: hypothetical protein SOY42_02555 [Clostridium sp.]|nr:hypothetical protein [Clostridium sp.]
MNYAEFTNIMNNHLEDNEKKNLLKKIAETPDRFIGLYRASNPQIKIMQFLLQSREIRFGDGVEEVIKGILEEFGFINLPNVIETEDGEDLDIDQYFKDEEGNYYFIEQKIRDDHDSSKKRGQIDNFKKKYEILVKLHGKVIGIMYFIDGALTKNKKFYTEELKKIEDEYKNEVPLLYGREFFEYFKQEDYFDTFESWFNSWRGTLPLQININFDEDYEETFNEVSKLEMKFWRKIISNENLWENKILQTLFPEAKVLKMLVGFWKKEGYVKEAKILEEMISKYKFKEIMFN